jgi:hypothetical protein
MLRRQMPLRMIGCVVLALSVGACGSDADADPQGGGGAGGNAAGTASEAGGGSGQGGAGQGTGGADGGLAVEIVEGSTMLGGMRSLCLGQCAALSASANGAEGALTYVWRGDDDSELTGSGPHQVCPTRDVTYTVTAMLPATEGEFATEAMQGSATFQVSVRECTGEPFGPCDARAPAQSFDAPTVEWSWHDADSYVTPLVANLTDDDGNGVVDLHDTPDVVVLGIDDDIGGGLYGKLFVLDGASGTEHFTIAGLMPDVTPALGDLEGDGSIDIVAMARTGDGVYDFHLAAFDRSGQPKWSSPPPATTDCAYSAAIALADLDHDGSVEILTSCRVYTAAGTLLWSAVEVATDYLYDSPVAVDLDGDGYLEVVFGTVAYRHDGTLYYSNAEVLAAQRPLGNPASSFFVAIGNLDADDEPEIVVSTVEQLFVLDEHGVTVHKTATFTPVLGVPSPTFAFPPAIADLDGDGTAEILLSNGREFTAYSGDLQERWSQPVHDSSGVAASTAFDFLGDGTSEALYADETTLWTFSGESGDMLMMQPRASPTGIEYPSVVDVDNDGSAELLLVHAYPSDGLIANRGLFVIGDSSSRWVPARRILNQDAYHVTNVNEDGSIPREQAPHWLHNNSFRAQAQVDATGATCLPTPE